MIKQLEIKVTGRKTQDNKSDTLYAGDGYEFCASKNAEEWYDFLVNEWKMMIMAGYWLGDCQAYRRKITQRGEQIGR